MSNTKSLSERLPKLGSDAFDVPPGWYFVALAGAALAASFVLVGVLIGSGVIIFSGVWALMIQIPTYAVLFGRKRLRGDRHRR